ncbi:MAG: N-acetylmuramoyl-L-alanine amidase, partial [Nitrospirae bacterium]
KYRADHAGLSLWNGIYDISSYSIGIELVGYHYGKITDRQYAALKRLLPVLQRIYHIPDRNVLTHSQVAYGRPNRWIRRKHRGRKKCAMNFNRYKAGLRGRWTYDPDVRAGRVVPDIQLASIFYGYGTRRFAKRSNVISRFNTAWSIAGGDYDDCTTVYKLPDGRVITGDKIEETIGWDKIPVGTVVLLNQNVEEFKNKGPIKIITEDNTAWSIAGEKFNNSTTFYFFPDGSIRRGNKIKDWDDIPAGTKMLIGYVGPYRITPKRTPFSLAGFKYKHKKVIYYLPGDGVKTGNDVKNFSNLPAGTKMFLPIRLRLRSAKL